MNTVYCKMKMFFIFAILSYLFAHEVTASAIDTASYFSNLRYKLSVDKKIQIAYFGGSITQGQGATNRATTSWRGLTTTWFKTNYPDDSIVEIDASWGATGSDLGAFRCTRDVTSKSPDLVFVEYAVNDWSKTSANIQPYMDGIVRNILRNLPNCVVIFIYAVHNNTITYYDKGTYPPAVIAQQAVADYYKIGSINIGKKMWEAIDAGNGSLQTLMSDSSTHPNDAGYKIYADEIAGVLKRYLLTPAAPSSYSPVTLPTAFTSNVVDNGVIVMANELSSTGWTTSSTGAVRFPYQIQSNTPGAVFTYTFTGTAIGMYWVQGPDGGEMKWSIDGSTGVQKTGYYSSSLGTYPVLSNTLAAGTHTLTITVLSDKNSSSSDYYIRMGALFVDEDIKTTGVCRAVSDNVNGFDFNFIPQISGGAAHKLLFTTNIRDRFSIDCINLSGKIIYKCFNGYLEPGNVNIDIPAFKLPAGAFIIKAASLKHRQTDNKLVFVK